jgi:hypothetical protein
VRLSSRFAKTGMACWLLLAVAFSLASEVWYKDRGASAAASMRPEWPLRLVQLQAGQNIGTEGSEGGTAVRRGMGKEAVRRVWGEPETIRKIRTCFGTREEWVYRGDPKRFGTSERVLLFDEGEVLTEIK